MPHFKKTSGILLLVFFFTMGCNSSGGGSGSVDLDDLEYGRVSAYSFLQADVMEAGTEKRVIWFQLFDQVDDQKTIDSYKGRSAPELLPYPAKVAKDMHIWILVGNRFEIRLIGDSKAPAYRNSEKLRDFILAFPLDEMEDYSGPKVEKDGLKQFIPKLAGLK
ncbi:MAG: hypothetical protein CMF59_09890 [Leptospiraceae bacterium]|nr:hypothetical protein [Leptospiraceae bacterium]